MQVVTTSHESQSPIASGFAALMSEIAVLEGTVERAQKVFAPVTISRPCASSPTDALPGGCCDVHGTQIALVDRLRSLRIKLDELIESSAL